VVDAAVDRAMLLDRAEAIAVNALPAPWRGGRMWQLQYHHQVNSFAAPQHEHPEDYDPDSLGYGLPYECCASNSEQGWPRYTQLGVAMLVVNSPPTPPNAATTAAAAAAPGLLLTGFAPSTIRAANGITVNISSGYPFDDATPIRLMMRSAGRKAFVDVRVPGWAEGATLQQIPCSNHSGVAPAAAVGGAPPGTAALLQLSNGTEHRVLLEAGVDSCALLELPMSVRIERRLHGAVAIYRGPLLYSLPLNYSAVTIDAYSAPHGIDESLTLKPGATWR
jgi:hypothetical protein